MPMLRLTRYRQEKIRISSNLILTLQKINAKEPEPLALVGRIKYVATVTIENTLNSYKAEYFFESRSILRLLPDFSITAESVSKNNVSFLFDAAKNICILREEVYNRMEKEKRNLALV